MKIRGFMIMVAICSLVFIVTTTTAFGKDGLYFDKAEDLNALGLFQGSSQGYELDRAPNRLEAGVMLIRLLGKEEEALASNDSHPFKDVPQWADAYVGYLYANSLTNGVAADLYGSGDLMNAKGYTTFVLRALGYDDAKGDFYWEEALEKAGTIGLMDEAVKGELQSETFLRGHMVLVSHSALSTELKDNTDTLMDKLRAEGVIPDNTGLYEEEIKNIPEVSSNGIIIFRTPLFSDDDFTIYIIREEVDEAIRNFAKLAQPGASKDMPFEEKLNYNINPSYEVSDYNSAGMGSMHIDFQSNYYTMFFYDEEQNLLGYYSIDPAEIVTGGKYFKDIRVVFQQPYEGKLRAMDFEVIRKINGEVDPEFTWTGGVTSSGVENGFQEEIVFRHLFFLDGTEYEIRPIDNKVKIQTVEVF